MSLADAALRWPADRGARRRIASAGLAVPLALLGILSGGAFLRLWGLGELGFNSDEAVYAGQAASIAHHADLSEFFPTFRSHPLLFQSVLSIGFLLGGYDLFGRVIAAVIGLATVGLTYGTGKTLYGRRVGLAAAAFMALMPYHVIVTRQVLLDGPMVFCTTLTLYLLARHATSARPIWLYAAGGAMGLTFLAKETGILVLGAIYAFYALSPAVRVRIRDLVVAGVVMGAIIAPFPLSMVAAGKSETGGQYLAWQLFRRPNHEWTFYPAEVPPAMGLLVVAFAALGLWLLRRQGSWRERLLLAWIAVPTVFFELWPTKGFQYLLPTAPAVAILAARTVIRWPAATNPVVARLRRHSAPITIGALATALLLLGAESWQRTQGATAGTFLAGSGGVPGGRETGAWLDANVPTGATVMTLGPSMANIIQYYGHRKALGLSVSGNPLRRNPAYEPILNPDLELRNHELNYIVWDSFSAARSPFFSRAILRYADRYNGRAIYTYSAVIDTPDGRKARKPLIIVYEVRPSIATSGGKDDD